MYYKANTWRSIESSVHVYTCLTKLVYTYSGKSFHLLWERGYDTATSVVRNDNSVCALRPKKVVVLIVAKIVSNDYSSIIPAKGKEDSCVLGECSREPCIVYSKSVVKSPVGRRVCACSLGNRNVVRLRLLVVVGYNGAVERSEVVIPLGISAIE